MVGVKPGRPAGLQSRPEGVDGITTDRCRAKFSQARGQQGVINQDALRTHRARDPGDERVVVAVGGSGPRKRWVQRRNGQSLLRDKQHRVTITEIAVSVQSAAAKLPKWTGVRLGGAPT